jgi:hypothetical protein
MARLLRSDSTSRLSQPQRLGQRPSPVSPHDTSRLPRLYKLAFTTKFSLVTLTYVYARYHDRLLPTCLYNHSPRPYRKCRKMKPRPGATVLDIVRCVVSLDHRDAKRLSTIDLCALCFCNHIVFELSILWQAQLCALHM